MNTTTRPIHIGQVMMENLESKTKNPIKLESMPNLNNAMGGGFASSSLNVVVASSGFGKTNWLVDTANKIAKDVPVVFFTCELTKEKLSDRFYASFLNCNFNMIQRLKTDSAMIEEFSCAVKHYSESYKLKISEETFIEDIVAQAIYENHNGECEMIIIDHLGEVNTKKNFRDINEKFSYICDLLLELYRNQGITVLTATQFKKSMNPMDDFGKRGMDDILGASVLRSRASLIIYLYCEYAESQENSKLEQINHYNATTCHLKLLKAREGWNGYRTRLYYNKPQVQFKQIPNTDYIPESQSVKSKVSN